MTTLFNEPIATSQPAVYPTVHHSQPPVGSKVSGPIQTNNTFNNLFLSTQTFPVWSLPYSLWVTRDGTSDHGVAFNHVEASQRVFGPDASKVPAEYYFNPSGIKSFTFSGSGWSSVDVSVTKSSKLASAIEVSNGNGKVTMPLVYGMGFLTAIYENTAPVICSSVGIQDFRKLSDVNGGTTTKYSAKLFNSATWTIYVSGDSRELKLSDSNHLVFPTQPAKAMVQIAKGDSSVYDTCCGMYPVDLTLGGSVDRSSKSGEYTLSYQTEGSSSSSKGLVWALPHHVASLTDDIKGTAAGISLDSPTKGVMQAYVTNELHMKVSVPTDIGFDPWTSVDGFGYDASNYTDDVKKLITSVAQTEGSVDIAAACDVDSMYYGGKQLDRFAYIAYVTHFILKDSDLTAKILPAVKAAIEKYANNKQQNPLEYEDSWKGVISTAPSDADFGNSNYNDHHFHYGYHVHAIALVARIDPSWLDSNNKLVRNYATTLIRDYANPSSEDPYFPQSRNFDWFHGHSFAHGIFPSGDGKNEESSSEDYHSVYALKLFGIVTGDEKMELGADLMMGVMRDSLQRYMLYRSDNKDEPSNFIGNKVSGILFENKIHYATFFGRGTIGDEWVHGIHMIPVTPASSYFRGQQYVKEEWDAWLKDVVGRIPDGWKGILMLNQGLFDPKTSWSWFASDDCTSTLLDPGMSRTWSLAMLAGIGAAK